jgi:hypothetical protein
MFGRKKERSLFSTERSIAQNGCDPLTGKVKGRPWVKKSCVAAFVVGVGITGCNRLGIDVTDVFKGSASDEPRTPLVYDLPPPCSKGRCEAEPSEP